MRLHHALPPLALVAGCLGGGLPDGGDDAVYGRVPDLGPLCNGNNDGVIDRSELSFPLGVSVNYLANPAGTTVSVNPDGTAGSGGIEWDLSSTSAADAVYRLTIESVGDKWFGARFPDASYATTTDLASGTLGVFKVTDTALLLLGYASPEPDKTLLVYDQPVATLHFPVQQGDAWVTGAKITQGKLNGAPFASTDTYRISVDARGTAVLPYLKFDNTLRVHVELAQAVPGGVSVSRIQYLFFHECFGELGRMVSTVGEQNPSFTMAQEFRRLAPP
jgi:hypothetical protein